MKLEFENAPSAPIGDWERLAAAVMAWSADQGALIAISEPDVADPARADFGEGIGARALLRSVGGMEKERSSWLLSAGLNAEKRLELAFELWLEAKMALATPARSPHGPDEFPQFKFEADRRREGGYLRHNPQPAEAGFDERSLANGLLHWRSDVGGLRQRGAAGDAWQIAMTAEEVKMANREIQSACAALNTGAESSPTLYRIGMLDETAALAKRVAGKAQALVPAAVDDGAPSVLKRGPR